MHFSFLRFYLERERAHTQVGVLGWERERERDKESPVDSTLSRAPHGAQSHDPEIMT